MVCFYRIYSVVITAFYVDYYVFAGCPFGYSLDFIGLGNCYKFATLKRNWTDARHDCQRTGNGDLVVIKTRREYDYIKKSVGGKDAWIGLSDLAVKDDWRWITCNRSGDYPETSSMMTKSTSGDCALLRVSDGRIVGSQCHINKPYVCQITIKGYQSIKLKPTNIAHTFLSPETLLLSWNPPVYSCEILGYRIKSQSLNVPHTYGDVMVKGADSTNYTLNVLSYNKYILEIRVVIILHGDIINSDWLHLDTPKDVPAVPANLRTNHLTSSSIELSWDQLSVYDKHGQMIGYRIQYQCNVAGAKSKLKTVLGEKNLTVSIYGLPAATWCGFQVQAQNDVGYGKYTGITYKLTKPEPTTKTNSHTTAMTTKRSTTTRTPTRLHSTSTATTAGTSSTWRSTTTSFRTSTLDSTAHAIPTTALPYMSKAQVLSHPTGTYGSWRYLLIIVCCIILGNIIIICVLVYMLRRRNLNKVEPTGKDVQTPRESRSSEPSIDKATAQAESHKTKKTPKYGTQTPLGISNTEMADCDISAKSHGTRNEMEAQKSKTSSKPMGTDTIETEEHETSTTKSEEYDTPRLMGNGIITTRECSTSTRRQGHDNSKAYGYGTQTRMKGNYTLTKPKLHVGHENTNTGGYATQTRMKNNGNTETQENYTLTKPKLHVADVGHPNRTTMMQGRVGHSVLFL